MDAHTPPLQWVDTNGRRWTTRLEIPASRELRDRGFDIRDHERLTTILGEPETLLDFAVEYLRPQFDKWGVDDLGCMVLLTATDSSLVEAHDAIVAGLLDFFRRCGDVKRAAVLERVVAAIATTTEAIMAKIESPQVDAILAAGLAQTMSNLDAQLNATAASFGNNYSKSSEKSEPATDPA